MEFDENVELPLKSLEMTDKIITIVGASGSGKTTLANKIGRSLNIPKLITTTTRPIRYEENHGKDYYFIGDTNFDKMNNDGQFLEVNSYSGHKYGLTFAEINKHDKSPCYVVTDVNGARAIADVYPDRVMVFWLHSKPSLLIKRLRVRGEKKATIFKRLIGAFQNNEFISPSKKFIDVSFTELTADSSIANNFGIIYYKLLVSEYSHNTTYLRILESERK